MAARVSLRGRAFGPVQENFFSSYVRGKVWNDEQKTSGVCSYFRARRSVWGCERLSGLRQQPYVSRTGLSGQDLALMENSCGGTGDGGRDRDGGST